MKKLGTNTFDIYSILSEDWFEPIGDFDSNENKYAPIDYDFVTISLYEGNSFFGGEIVDLLVNKKKRVFYIRSAIRQPIGDYGWGTIWAWYISKPENFDDIVKVIKKEG